MKEIFKKECVHVIENGLSFLNSHADNLFYKSEINTHFYDIIDKINKDESLDLKRELRILHELIETETSSINTIYQMNKIYKIIKVLDVN